VEKDDFYEDGHEDNVVFLKDTDLKSPKTLNRFRKLLQTSVFDEINIDFCSQATKRSAREILEVVGRQAPTHFYVTNVQNSLLSEGNIFNRVFYNLF